jgi:hypothetical protein
MGKPNLLLAILGAGTILFGSLEEASATTRRMECREWVDKEYRGIYSFMFDDEGSSLVVSYKPEGKYPLFGQSVDTWKLLWRKDLIAVFYGISDDWWAPVRVMSLHFGKPATFPYGLGSEMENDRVISKISRECKRLD